MQRLRSKSQNPQIVPSLPIISSKKIPKRIQKQSPLNRKINKERLQRSKEQKSRNRSRSKNKIFDSNEYEDYNFKTLNSTQIEESQKDKNAYSNLAKGSPSYNRFGSLRAPKFQKSKDSTSVTGNTTFIRDRSSKSKPKSILSNEKIGFIRQQSQNFYDDNKNLDLSNKKNRIKSEILGWEDGRKPEVRETSINRMDKDSNTSKLFADDRSDRIHKNMTNLIRSNSKINKGSFRSKSPSNICQNGNIF